jgi:hypothetical protein
MREQRLDGRLRRGHARRPGLRRDHDRRPYRLTILFTLQTPSPGGNIYVKYLPAGQSVNDPAVPPGFLEIAMLSNRLAGKVALVTGVGSGIGQGCALMMAHHGARVVGCDINPMLRSPPSPPRKKRASTSSACTPAT